MLSIGTKKYRNLQEQVGYNTECIKKLADAIDGITIEDKLVVIETDSGTFTDEELVILSGPLAFIADESKVWMKQSETLTELVYKAIDIVATEVSSTYFNIGGSKIVVNRETGAYNTSSDTIIATYSNSQIDSIISTNMALKANVSGQAFTGDISAPKVIQVNPNLNVDISRWLAPSGLTATPIYTKMFVEANLDLHVVVCLKISNDTASPITISNRVAYTQANYVNASSEIVTSGYASKIFDLLGTSLDTVLPANTYRAVRIGKAYASQDITSNRPSIQELSIVFTHYSTGDGSNAMGFDIYGLPSTTFNADESMYICAEMNLTL